MSEERLERVERFEDLRASDLIVLKDCSCFGSAHPFRGVHRGMLLTPSIEPGREVVSFSFSPEPACAHRHHNLQWRISEKSVRERRLYRVIIPPASETREVAQPKKLERQGVR